jgi:hypothetical protein
VLLLVLSLMAAACGAQALAFTIGDCVNIPDGAEITDYESVDCDEPHDHEVFALPQHPDGEGAPYPGQDALLEFAQQRCDEAFEGYVGTDYASSALYLTALTPSEEAWTDAGDREIVCLLAGEPVDGEFTQLTGSKEGSGE